MFLDPGWVILILLVVLLITGLPISFVLGVTAATMIVLDPAVVPQIIGLAGILGGIFISAMLEALVLINLFPALSLWLPSVIL